jgi:hypothetical protein
MDVPGPPLPGVPRTYELDGLNGNELLDAKYARPPAVGPSPYRNEAQPFVQNNVNADVESSFIRARRLIDDPTNPFDIFVIRSNDANTIPYFNARAAAAGVPQNYFRIEIVD